MWAVSLQSVAGRLATPLGHLKKKKKTTTNTEAYVARGGKAGRENRVPRGTTGIVLSVTPRRPPHFPRFTERGRSSAAKRILMKIPGGGAWCSDRFLQTG